MKILAITLRFFIAILLIPFAAAITQVLYKFIIQSWPSCFIFLAGVFGYTFVYPVFSKPLRGYVLGHELTHVLGVWLFRGKIHKMKVSRKGGVVKANKTNIWIKLAPYFFPIYTILVLGIYLLFSIAWDLNRIYGIFVFILGITWAFHFWMTIHILWQNQPDVRESGTLFSLVVIYVLNVLVLAGLFIFISPKLTIRNYFTANWQEINNCYLWIAQKLI